MFAARNEGGVQQGPQLELVGVEDPERLLLRRRRVGERALGEACVAIEPDRGA
jgi:hypothetical protein